MTKILKFIVVALMALVFFSSTGSAVLPGERLQDKNLEQRARDISQQLRCLVCQNESIDASDADLAHDLRLLVRKRLLAGDSDQEVKAYIVARYGQYVLLKPEWGKTTYILWLSPIFFAFYAAAAGYIYLRQLKDAVPHPPLSTDEKQRLRSLLNNNWDNPPT